eukprot:5131117-Amphidinium_carterae.1
MQSRRRVQYFATTSSPICLDKMIGAHRDEAEINAAELQAQLDAAAKRATDAEAITPGRNGLQAVRRAHGHFHVPICVC